MSKPHGVATIIFTVGERTAMWMSTLALFPNWEFTASAFLYNKDDQWLTGEGYSTSFYAKWMLYENKAKTGGFAIKFGTGMEPSYVLSGTYQDASKTVWMNTPLTIPFFGWRVSWDLMPGVSIGKNLPEGGETEETVASFTYSTRLAWYPVNPKWALVVEVYGSAGKSHLSPEFKAGFRWEPSVYANIALTYDRKFDGSKGDGLELGVMLFTPP